jgi:hypothetical protein
MEGEHYGGEEKYPRVKLDKFEQSLATLMSMVSQLLATKCKETPSTEAFHEGPKKEENKPETMRKTDPEMGECNYSKTHGPFSCRGQGGNQSIYQVSGFYQDEPMDIIDGSILQRA